MTDQIKTGKDPELSELILFFNISHVKNSLISSFQKDNFCVEFLENEKEIVGNIRELKPSLFVMDAETSSKIDTSILDKIKSTLKENNIISLILTQDLQQIQFWKEINWPNCYFHFANMQSKAIHDKIVLLLNDHHLLDRPHIAVVSPKPHFINHFEMHLNDYGIRIESFAPPSTIERLQAIEYNSPTFLIWDIASWEGCPKTSSLHCETLQHMNFKEIFFVYDPWPKAQDLTTLSLPEFNIYTLDQSNEIVTKITQTMKLMHPKVGERLRDHQSGLYLPELFEDEVRKNWAQSSNRSPRFAIAKFKLENLNLIENEFGFIFASELKHNIGLFIQNRVRSSDLVAQGHHGEILLFLDEQPQEAIGGILQRLKDQFQLIASFNQGSKESFIPQLCSDYICYPSQTTSLDELLDFIRDEKKPLIRESRLTP